MNGGFLLFAALSLANSGLGLAFFLAAGLIVKRSIPAAFLMAIAGFVQVGAELLQHTAVAWIRIGISDMYLVATVIDFFDVVCVFGSIILAVRELGKRPAP